MLFLIYIPVNVPSGTVWMDANRPETVANSNLIDLLNLRLPHEENQIKRDTVSKIETRIKR